jgi:hypothetical protein
MRPYIFENNWGKEWGKQPGCRSIHIRLRTIKTSARLWIATRGIREKYGYAG